MKPDVHQLVQSYLKWISERVSVRQDGEWTEINTPYLDRHNDFLQIFLKQQGHDLILTDGGWILDDLSMGGCELSSPRRRTLLHRILQAHGVDLVDGELRVVATPHSFPAKKHLLLQAMMAVNDMFLLAQPTVDSLFFEQVEGWLKDNEIPVTPRVKVTGKSRLDYSFDFIIPALGKRPETILQVLSAPDVQRAKLVAFGWLDTREFRPEGARAMAMLNDSERVISNSVLDALQAYDVQPQFWSRRGEALRALKQVA